MLAARLCYKWGIEDVEAWIDRVPKRVLDFWVAFDAVEPIGEQWRQTAETNVLLERLMEWEAAKHGQKFEPATVENHMPARYIAPKKPKPKQTEPKPTNTDFERVAATLGLSKIVKKYGRNNKPS